MSASKPKPRLVGEHVTENYVMQSVTFTEIINGKAVSITTTPANSSSSSPPPGVSKGNRRPYPISSKVRTFQLDADLSGNPVDEKNYRAIIGSLLYLTTSRPDIMFTTGVCTRFQCDPRESHLHAVKRILKYLKGTLDFGLWDKLVSRSSRKQNCVSLSTAEAEYVAAACCCSQVLWMKTQLADYGYTMHRICCSRFKIPVYCDSSSAIQITTNPVQHSQTKHIDIRYHFIKDHVEKGNIELFFVESERQLADLFTKAFDEKRHYYILICRSEARFLNNSVKDPVYKKYDFCYLRSELVQNPVSGLHSKFPKGMSRLVVVVKKWQTRRTTPSPIDNAADNTLISPEHIHTILHNNEFVDLDNLSVQHSIILEILRAHPIAYAMTATADIPGIYLQQLWHTAQLETRNGVLTISWRSPDGAWTFFFKYQPPRSVLNMSDTRGKYRGTRMRVRKVPIRCGSRSSIIYRCIVVTTDLLEPFEEPERESSEKRNKKKSKANKVRPRALIFEMGDEAPMWTARRAAPTVPTNPITKPNLNKEISGKLLHMIKDLTFNGKNDSNPIVHMENFVDICDLFKTEADRDDAIRLRVFPLTLIGEARAWLRSLEPSSITTWEGLRSKFLSRFFPPSKIDKLRAEIRSFQQQDGETISEAWERFKHLLNSCPSHELNKSEQVQTFYSGLAYSSRATLDSSAGGVFMYKTPTEGYKLLEDMLIHNIDWRTDKRLQIPRMAGKISTDFDPSDELAAMKNQQVKFERKIEELIKSVHALQVGCEECNGPHLTKDCPNKPMMTPEEVNYINRGDYQGRWNNNRNFIPRPPGFFAPTQ
ncbi:hypothetical protein OSB04_002178 [Centaurea solstitialis]|uniref:Retrotransposon gag domain-containing protein n=1 Tax=Centaurea solstitialis TaxID=347529 RepID=A0AA38WMI0_9ASTR|nr:hypothetical protein OSB04_002178 [Centaurea solstitialis]